MNTWSGSEGSSVKAIRHFGFVSIIGVLMAVSLHGQTFDHRDLHGVWTNATITPFERPVELGDKEFLTEKEMRDLEAQAAVSNADRPPQSDANYRWWLDLCDLL